MRKILAVAALGFVSLSVVGQQKKQAEAGFTLEQVMKAPFVLDLSAAPAKGRIAWVTKSEGRRNLWVAEPNGAGWKAQQLTHYMEDDGQELADISWTPDGDWISYTRGGPIQGAEHPVPNPAGLVAGVDQQVWVINAAGGEPKLIAKGHGGEISPRGDAIAFVQKGQVWTASLQGEVKAKQLFEGRGSMRNLRWSPDGSAIAFVTERGDHGFVGIYRFGEKALTWADPGTGFDDEPVWSPDGNRIAFIRNPTNFDDDVMRWAHEGQPWEIHVADAKTGEGSVLWRAEPGRGSLYREVVAHDVLIWASDGFIVFPWERDGWTHLYSIPWNGGKVGILTPGNFEVEQVAHTNSGKTILFSSNQVTNDPKDVDRRHVWTVTSGGWRAPEQLTKGEGLETFPVATSDGKVVVIRSDVRWPVHPASVAKDGVLTDIAPELMPKDFPVAQMIVPQQVIFPAADGMMIHGQLWLPKTHQRAKNGKDPAIVFFHGGSRRQIFLGWHTMEYYANTYAENEYLASLGYVVLSVNYRSGIGYGMEFRQATNFSFNGASEYNDVIGAGLFMRNRADADTSRIGAWGGSYGGYLTALALARGSDMFAAGVDLHGVHDWTLEVGLWRAKSDSVPDAEAQRKVMAARSWESSPFSSLDTWRSPVLLIQGDDDRNVVFSQTVRLAEALRERHVDVEEKVFPDEVHDFLLQKDWLTTFRMTADFFDRKMPAK